LKRLHINLKTTADMSSRKTICIIKLDGIGDVLRTTPILRRFPDAAVTWVTESPAMPLLQNNPFIQNIIPLAEAQETGGFVFDELYNFDEDLRACRLADAFSARKKKGFTGVNGNYAPFDADAQYAFTLSKDDALKFGLNKKTYQQIIFEMAGLKWKGEDYVLGYQPKSEVQYSVGINYLVGRKFPNKAWPHWQKLLGMLDSACAQTEFPSLEEYVDWINSCRIIVTGDTLGMHIALALKKKVVILMGSTSWNEIEVYNRGVILRPSLDCMPCYKKVRCHQSPFCMDLITPERVYSEIQKISA
jgi:heptosyltransferase II